MEDYSTYKVTLGWDAQPTIAIGPYVLPRKAEDIIHKKFYPNGSGTWPINPITQEKLLPEEKE